MCVLLPLYNSAITSVVLCRQHHACIGNSHASQQPSEIRIEFRGLSHLKMQDLSLKTKQCFVTALDLTWKWTYKEVTTATGFQSRERMSCLNKAADEKPESFKGWGSTNTRKGKHNDGKTQGLGPADWWDSLQSEFRVRFFSPEHSIKPLCDSKGDLQSLLLQKPL